MPDDAEHSFLGCNHQSFIVPFIRRRHAGTSKFAATGCSQYSLQKTVSSQFLNGVHRNIFNAKSIAGLRKVDAADRHLTIGTNVIQTSRLGLGSTSIFISRWKHMWPELPGPASIIFVVCDRCGPKLVSLFPPSWSRSWITATRYWRIYRLQRWHRSRESSMLDLGPHDHVTPALYELHWLPNAERIKFKLCLLVHHLINGQALSYLTEFDTSVANVPGHASLSRKAWSGRSAIKTGFVRAGFFRCDTKSLEQSARQH